VLDQLECGAISFSKLYYSLCSTLLREHVNLFLYTLIHENVSFRSYVLNHHRHDLDYLLMPQLEVLYREVDISKHHVYMIINTWILLTQSPGFDTAIRNIRVKDVPFFKEAPLKDLALTQVMQIVLLRTLQLNLRTKLKEPHIFNNCLASFCNLTITALIGPPLPTPATTPAGTPATSPGSGPSSASTSGLGGLLSVPLTLHPQVSFRLTRVLCILSRKFLALQLRHEAQVAAHNARIQQLAAEGRDTLNEDEEVAELALEEVAEELGTCMEFIQLLLEVVNHAIVHALPAPHPLAPPSAALAAQRRMSNPSGSSSGGLSPTFPDGSAPLQSSLSTNPHLLYNLLASKAYFTQLLPYAHLFEPHLISNVTNVIAFYERAQGVELPKRPNAATAGGVLIAEQSGGGRANHASRASEKDVERCVAALSRAVSRTPMHLGSSTPSGPSPSSGPRPDPIASALPPASYPAFDAAALIERGPFTYHEQDNAQDFFIPYVFQLCQSSLRILPRMSGEGGSGSVPSTGPGSGGGGDSSLTSPSLGDVDADAEYVRELQAEEDAAVAASLGLDDPMRQQMLDEEEELFGPRAEPYSTPADDFNNLRIVAIK